ncbi:MAG: hypothetical protein AAF549_03005 [Pseudomonadota bacterium]
MTSFPHHRISESGNILIYVLGAIVLLGILIAVVRGASAPGSNIQEEELIIRTSEIQEYGHELDRAIAFILRNGLGHTETDIRFAHPDADPNYGDITDDPTRQMFSPQGGGSIYRIPPEDIQSTPTNWVFTARNQVFDVGTTDEAGGGNEYVELVAILPNVIREFCIVMNARNNITNPLGEPPQDDGNVSFDEFLGSYDYSEDIHDGSGFLAGELEGCFEGGGSPPPGTYHYYRVLIPR